MFLEEIAGKEIFDMENTSNLREKSERADPRVSTSAR